MPRFRSIFVPGVAVASLLIGALDLSAQTLAAHQLLARDVYKQLIEINTSDSVGDNTAAAEAMAARFRAAGFPAGPCSMGSSICRWSCRRS